MVTNETRDMQIIRLLTVMILSLGLWLGCAQNEIGSKRDPDLLVVGLEPNYPPFESVDSATGEITGFDVELIKLLCDANRWRYQIVPTAFDELLGGLASGDLDIAISAISITPEREVLASFSDPYYLTGQGLVVAVGDSATTDLADLRGKRVGVMAGTTGEKMVKRTDGVLVFPYADIARALEDLAGGGLDAVVNDKPNTRELLKGVEALRLVPGTLNSEYYGICMRPADSIRLAKLNDALAGLMGGYTYERLHAKWFGYPPMDIEVPDSVAAQWPSE